MFRFRTAPLKTAAILAAGFILLRIAYRALFNGLNGAGVLLLDVPAVRLPPPFAHVALFGPVTTGGLQTAVLSALPIALVILAFGALNAVVDVSRLFARGARSGPLRGLSRALVIAWATFPALTDAVASVRVARRLRAERGTASLLVPLFERTVERAVAVAATMEVRGFAATRPAAGVCEKPVVLRGVGIGYDGRRMLRDLDLDLTTGTLTVIAGPTGCGKTTLLHALSGLLTHVDGGEVDGRVEVGGVDRLAVAPRDTAGFVGVVLQQPRLGFASETVADEIGFALDVRGVASVIVAARVTEVAEHVGIAHLVGRDIRSLSAGEATLVAIAAAIVERPTVLLVDEPLADLDLEARARIVGLLAGLAHDAGVCVVVAEHRVGELAGVADAVLTVTGGRLLAAESFGADASPAASAAASAAARYRSSAAQPLFQARDGGTIARREDVGGGAVADAGCGAATGAGGGAVVAEIRGLSVTHAGTPAVVDARLGLSAGEVVAITGANGAGKSSLLTAIALPSTGTVLVDGVDVATLAPRARRQLVGLVPDESDDLLFSTTVAAECRRADRSARLAAGTTAAVFGGFLGVAARTDAVGALPAELGRRHPRDLSTGERRLLTIAIQLGAEPRVLLVDEPTRGLDGDARRLVGSALRAAAASGAAVVIATHDRGFAAEVAGREVGMTEGRIGDVAAGPLGFGGDSVAASASGSGASTASGSAPTTAAAQREHPLAEARERSERAEAEEASAGPLGFGGDSVAASASGGGPSADSGIGASTASGSAPSTGTTQRRLPWQPWLLTAGSLLAAAAFAWPLLVPALPTQAQAAAPYAAIALLPFVLATMVLALDGEVRSAKTLALLGTLTAIGAAVRVVGTGVGGVEAVFVLLILAGRAFGARFGFLLGVLTIALSSTMWGGFGPWTPFQMFACGWVGAGAGLLPRRATGPSIPSGTAATPLRDASEPAAVGPGSGTGTGTGTGTGEIAMLALYGVLASYAFGLAMNLWFWPFAVGTASGIAYVPGASVAQNAGSFLLYSFVTSTLTWDTLRAITSVIGVVVAGPAVLAALRRAKLPARASVARPRSTSPRGGGTRTRRSTAPDAAAAPPTEPRPSVRA